MADEMIFQNAGVKHFIWKKKLRGVLDGKLAIDDVEKISHKDCEFGQWLYAEGLKKFGEIKEMLQLEEIHLETHNIGNKIIQLCEQNQKEAAELEYKKIDESTQKMVHLLTLLSVHIDSDKKGEKLKSQDKKSITSADNKGKKLQAAKEKPSIEKKANEQKPQAGKEATLPENKEKKQQSEDKKDTAPDE